MTYALSSLSGFSLSLEWAQSHDWDKPLGSALVGFVWRVNLYQARPELGLLFFAHSPRQNRETLSANCKLAGGVGLEVEIPAWVLRTTTLRCHDNEVVPIGEI
jgi:hypothetical protein